MVLILGEFYQKGILAEVSMISADLPMKVSIAKGEIDSDFPPFSVEECRKEWG